MFKVMKWDDDDAIANDSSAHAHHAPDDVIACDICLCAYINKRMMDRFS
jgi:delta-aminolevulinic acid dehydratase/porphobilinogen synthase